MVLADVVLTIEEESHEGQMKLHQVRVVDGVCLRLQGKLHQCFDLQSYLARRLRASCAHVKFGLRSARAHTVATVQEPSELAAVCQVYRLGEVLEHLVTQALEGSEQLVVVLQIDRLDRRQNREQVRLEGVLLVFLFKLDYELIFKRARWISK